MAKTKRYTRKQVRRNRIIAACCLAVVAALIIALVVWGIVSHFRSAAQDESSSAGPAEESLSSGSGSSQQSGSARPGYGMQITSVPDSSTGAESSSSGVVGQDTGDPYYEADWPILVNPDNYIPDGYSPDVTYVDENYQLETRAAAAWQQMQSDASEDGVNLWIISAYRTLDRQITLYNEKVEEYEGLGYDEEEAKTEAAKWVAVPGTSEHCLGLAMDLCSLEESFEDTDQFSWLQEHCAEYGFILRYPKDKVDTTKISYEPWHYRYVGSNHAKIIMENGLCLEEYLEQYAPHD